jgi:hypothetical protein
MVATLTPSTVRAEYLAVVEYSRRFTAEDVFFGGAEFPDIDAAANSLIEAGETAWGVPEFERSIFDLFKAWARAGQLLRCSLYGGWLLKTAPDSSRDWLRDFSSGELAAHCDRWQLSNDVLGTPEQYLYPLRLNHLIAAQRRRDQRKSEAISA